jgi:CRP-like cAMP-binding protein
MPLVGFFQKLSLFHGVESTTLFELVPRISLDFQTFHAGEVIARESEDTMGLLYLIEGRVLGSFLNKTHQFLPYDLVSFSGVFGTSKTSLLTLTAVDSSKILVIDNKSLLYLIQHSQEIATTYLNMLAGVTDPDRCVDFLYKNRNI